MARPTDGDLLVADASSGDLTRLSVSADGVRPAVAAHARPHLSDTGRTVVFDTLAAADLLGGSAPAAARWSRSRAPRACRWPKPTSAPRSSGSRATSGTSRSSTTGRRRSCRRRSRSATVDSRSTPRRARARSTCRCRPVATARCVLTFTPSSPGPVSATLTVAEEGYQATSVSARVRGAGGDPTLRISPAGQDLGRRHRRRVEPGVLLRREEHLDVVDLDQFGDGRRCERP